MAIDDLEHPLAVYYDSNDERHEMRADDLGDPATLDRARRNSLLDKSEQVRLSHYPL